MKKLNLTAILLLLFIVSAPGEIPRYNPVLSRTFIDMKAVTTIATIETDDIQALLRNSELPLIGAFAIEDTDRYLLMLIGPNNEGGALLEKLSELQITILAFERISYMAADSPSPSNKTVQETGTVPRDDQ